ncbi:antiholin-like protein LrgB [Streptococcus sobrinus]|uniref:Antiholin-like protein LrgB n=1 Tax=Streptococcus sobrinus W1703 TaxID=1227275 RepID=U2K9Y7_9STRE|nr:antiholin-like protein LrgB [Streptococcus sobrinus]AWN19289.1 antiholin-like protein LrgB [Streptococcus sobrinus]AWN61242.1 antiholin-like protein LrgB [Streptococcus sobrinus]AWN63115.1 antiholin-like protein LrgB [Streptococcus sobrinus]ERJ73984.1 antiholin-like protein LrgB [Streptococcus sobrinus W1703]SQG19316.1 murein hydrolase regulator LrgB [Streptococcus sobrinus]
MELLKSPIFGICFSLILYTLGSYLFKKTKGFFLLQPLFFAMVLGIIVLYLMAKGLGTDIKTLYTQAYKPGGDLIFWFLNPATIAFAIPLYKKNDVVKKYWREIISSLVAGMVVSVLAIMAISKLFGLSTAGTASMLPQAATTAIALPIAHAIGGNTAITAMACILNAVIIYALGRKLVKIFRLNRSDIGVGLGLGTSGHTVGAAFALELGDLQGAMAAISVVVIGLVVDLVVPVFGHFIA